MQTEDALRRLATVETRQPYLMLHNLESDGIFLLGDQRFVWAAPGGMVLAASRGDEEEWDAAALVMIGSIVVEALGVVAAIAGISLPTGKTLDRLGMKIWGRLKPEQRAEFIRFMAKLLDPATGLEAKVRAIFELLRWLHGLGLIHLALNDLLDGMDWWDIGLTIAQLLLTLASLLIPGAAAAAFAARLVAISNALITIIRKAKNLKENLKTA